MNPLFPQLPDDLAMLSDEEVSQLLDASMGVVQAIHDGDAEVLAGRDDETLLTDLTAGIAGIDALRSELDARTTPEVEAEPEAAVDEARDRIAALAAETLAAATPEEEAEDAVEKPEADEAPDHGEEVGGTEEEEARAEAEPEAVAASATSDEEQEVDQKPRVPKRYTPAKRVEPEVPRMQPIMASGDVRGITAGSNFESREQFIDALISRHDALSAVQNGRDGVFEDVPVGTIKRDFPEHMGLVASGRSSVENQATLLAAIGGEPGSHQQAVAMGGKALTADGGLCAPLAPSYDIPTFGVTATPVNDSLPTVPATRGGIRWWPIMPWNSGANAIDDAITHLTKAQSDAGGSPAYKTYQRIVCPTDDNEAYVDSFVKRVRIENLKGRAWPELVEAFMRNLDVAYAAEVEINALDFIAASLPLVTAPALGNLSTVSTWVHYLAELTAGISSRNRLDPNARYRCLLPSWVPDLLLADNVKSQFDRFRAQAEVEALLRRARIDVTYYLDSASGAGQLFGSQSADAEITNFPATAKGYLYPEGAFVRLEFGQMDLGITRDSTLNTVNEYELFVEEWHGYAYIGAPEAYEMNLAVCPTGQTTGTVAELACGSGN